MCVALVPILATAQQKPASAKKLYCWDQNGQRVCADSLPPEAMAAAREEISLHSGMRTGEVQRALTDEERAARAEEEARRRTEALAAETRRRTDQAILTTFQDEDELRRVFTERLTLVDNSIQTARYNVTSLREGLVTLLRVAGERELGGKPVPDKLADDIRHRHAQLIYHQSLQRSFERQRGALDAEIDEIVERFRTLKSNDAPGARGAFDPPAVSGG
ncbi:hypothetical protein B1992_06545 [Pseudoxanthomonas broegbernensis]|uniref:DUF4124 domain-containing protein n=1 Tax=Pseudoxanthomonas broegbernensis TaxID=83619 RepID=A0A7V8K7Z3_9GAMM|nr:hypothetical protein [Pseudoxanthomonas broegbernensis]KAF1687064.1 hypothetical protein B1992_06545 [Pseudoxanthomonas broegbernensis]